MVAWRSTSSDQLDVNFCYQLEVLLAVYFSVFLNFWVVYELVELLTYELMSGTLGVVIRLLAMVCRSQKCCIVIDL